MRPIPGMDRVCRPYNQNRGRGSVISNFMESRKNNRGNELLQSEKWLKFQEAAGKQVIRFFTDNWSANGVVHSLPFVGKYLYVPKGPLGRIRSQETGVKEGGLVKSMMESLSAKAKEEDAGWIRIEPETDEVLAEIRNSVSLKLVKAPHDMQPRETFRVSLALSEEELLASMKSKTRYNIRIAEKRGVKIISSTEKRYRDEFIRLVTGTAERKGIAPHPVLYYEAMLETLLGADATILAAEKDGEVVAANLLTFFGDTATYLHGGSDDRHRADMAPFLLQWEGLREAKRRGCSWYDFGGVSTAEFEASEGKWLGITRFKFGFSPDTRSTVFPGAYDIVVSPSRYATYLFLQRIRTLLSSFGKR